MDKETWLPKGGVMTLRELRLQAIINRIKDAIRQGECDLEELQDLTKEDIKELKNENHRT